MIHEVMVHLWQSTLFAIAAALLTLAFRKNRAKVRFGLWLSASLKFFIPFALLMNLGSQIQWTPATRQVVTEFATPAVSFAVEYVAEPFSAAVSPVPAAPRGTNWKPILVLGFWACGFVAIVTVRLRLWRRIRAALLVSTPLEIAAPVGVRAAPGLLEPGVVGLLKPVLLLPEGIVDRLTPSELEAVLAHELCHVRRRDNLFATVHMIAEAVFWFHPLVWWIGARMVEERERACDEDVLNLGNQPRVYAEAILNVCKLYAESPLVCVSGVTGSDIRGRIEAIMTNRKGQTLNRAKKSLLAVAGVAALAGPVIVGIVIGIGHVPAILAQSPVAFPSPAPNAIPILAQSTPARSALPPSITVAPSDTPVAPQTVLYKDRRLVAMLFDFTGMTPDDQARARGAGISYLQNLTPADLVTVMLAGTGRVTVAQDFTDNVPLLQAAIGKLSAPATDPASSTAPRFANIETAAKMLAGFPEKKALLYFSAAVTQTGPGNQVELESAVTAAKMANVAIFPIDVRSTTPPALVPADLLGGLSGAAPVSGGYGRGPSPGGRSMQPANVSREEYDRRVAYAQTNFGSLNTVMGRMYVRYGAPDQIETPSVGTQIWRYKFVEDFHGGVAFEFTGTRPTGTWVLYPPPLATYSGETGVPAQLAPLADALARESQASGKTIPTVVIPGFPGRHISVEIGNVAPGLPPQAGRFAVAFTVPLDTLSGQIDIVGQVTTRLDTGARGQIAGNLRDSAPASNRVYQAAFTVTPGAWVLNVIAREAATGRIFGETINFDVK